MMKSGLELLSDVVEDFARSCRRTAGSSSSCIETLERIAALAAPRIDDLFLAALREPDEITVQFLDLIDQIVFECSEQSHAQPSVKEYIAEHLSNRLFIYLDAICNPETYALNCKKRDLTPDDAVIIRARRMEECISLLMQEFHEQPQMQSHILRALLAFDADGLLNLYYEAARSQSIVVASLALIGLKKCGPRFRFWKNLQRQGGDYGSLYDYARSFDCAAVGRNPLPVDPPSLLFVLQFLDLNLAYEGFFIRGNNELYIRTMRPRDAASRALAVKRPTHCFTSRICLRWKDLRADVIARQEFRNRRPRETRVEASCTCFL